MFTTDPWVTTIEDRDLSRAAAERYFMLQAATATCESCRDSTVLTRLFRRLLVHGHRRRLAGDGARPHGPMEN